MKAYRLINPMDTRHKSHHCIGCTLPNIKCKFDRRARKYNIIINRKNGICTQILNLFESIVQTVFLVDIKLQFNLAPTSRVWLYNVVQKFLKGIRWWFRLTPHYMNRFKPTTQWIVRNGLLQKIISFPCIHYNSISFPVHKIYISNMNAYEQMVIYIKKNEQGCWIHLLLYSYKLLFVTMH